METARRRHRNPHRFQLKCLTCALRIRRLKFKSSHNFSHSPGHPLLVCSRLKVDSHTFARTRWYVCSACRHTRWQRGGTASPIRGFSHQRCASVMAHCDRHMLHMMLRMGEAVTGRCRFVTPVLLISASSKHRQCIRHETTKTGFSMISLAHCLECRPIKALMLFSPSLV
eukprot:3542787-Pleurochrysis_carterae.AAC.2